jgi:ATP-dependent RNA helicase DDX23/PRP28
MPPLAAPGGADITSASAGYAPPVSGDDLDAICARYLGADKKKRKVRKVSDRKFVFDWHATDDTAAVAADAAAAGPGAPQNRAAVIFGRGRIAGMLPL